MNIYLFYRLGLRQLLSSFSGSCYILSIKISASYAIRKEAYIWFRTGTVYQQYFLDIIQLFPHISAYAVNVMLNTLACLDNDISLLV